MFVKWARCGSEYFLISLSLAKPAETRMGKGKGSLDHWVSVVKPGRILFEIEGVDREMAEEAFRNAGHKLPIKTKLVERRPI